MRKEYIDKIIELLNNADIDILDLIFKLLQKCG